MRRIQFAATIAATGLWIVAGTAAAQSDQTNRDQRRQDTQSSDQTNRRHRRDTTSTDQTATAQNTSGTLSKSDRDFLTKAAEGGMAEVQLGKMAQEKGTSEAVKNLGQKLVDDHTKANNDLQQLAQSKSVTLPTEPDSKQKSEMDRLSRLSDGEFDREFARHVDRDHKKDISEFRKEADKGSDPDVKSFASRYLPTLEEHENLAKQAMSGTNEKNPRTDEAGQTTNQTGKKGKRQPDYK